MVFGVKVLCSDVVLLVAGMLVRTVFGVKVMSVFSVVGCDSWLVLVTGDVGGAFVGSVMTMSGGQVRESFQKVTSARCTQYTIERGEWNRRVYDVIVVVDVKLKHTLTRESQEVGATSNT